MNFEVLKKSHLKRNIIIGVVAVTIISAVVLNFTRAKYRTTQSIPLVNGTINYVKSDLNLIALNIENSNGEYVNTNTVPSSGYILNEEKSYCEVNSSKDNNTKIVYSGGQLNVNHITKKGTKCYIYFDIPKQTAKEYIMSKIIVQTTTPDFSKAAVIDEGVFSISDPVYGGTSYYWRGAVENNYIKFANRCWRIIRINGDGSLRIIGSSTTCTENGDTGNSISSSQYIYYNSAYNKSEYVGWTYTQGYQRPASSGIIDSNAKKSVDEWYEYYSKYETKIAEGKYCNDREVQQHQNWVSTGSSFNYAAYERLNQNFKPSLSCSSNDIYTLKAGLITADEAMLAGLTFYEGVENTYLKFGINGMWTMTPAYYNGSASMFRLWWGAGKEVSLSASSTNGYTHSIIPVINLRSEVILTGSGTIDDPYVVA